MDIAALTSPALFIIILLMIVGGSPGSTAGGIKTTTTAIVMALIRSQAFGRDSVEMMERRIPPADVARALATTAMYLLTLIIGVTLLLLAQGSGETVVKGHQEFLGATFECVSALSTVGLSMNYTPLLTDPGRLIVIALMICGRLGPISIALTFVGQTRGARYLYAEETVMTG